MRVWRCAAGVQPPRGCRSLLVLTACVLSVEHACGASTPLPLLRAVCGCCLCVSRSHPPWSRRPPRSGRGVCSCVYPSQLPCGLRSSACAGAAAGGESRQRADDAWGSGRRRKQSALQTVRAVRRRLVRQDARWPRAGGAAGQPVRCSSAPRAACSVVHRGIDAQCNGGGGRRRARGGWADRGPKLTSSSPAAVLIPAVQEMQQHPVLLSAWSAADRPAHPLLCLRLPPVLLLLLHGSSAVDVACLRFGGPFSRHTRNRIVATRMIQLILLTSMLA